jgi:hypothetical protein
VTEIADKINQFSREFDDRCFSKHELGEEKYGPGTWLGIDTIEHALDEVVDLGNYVRMTFIKLRLLQEGLVRIQEGSKETAAPIAGKEMLGKDSILGHGRMPE